MENFWDFSVWGSVHVFATLLMSLLLAHMLKRSIPALQATLIPTSVLGGLILLLISGLYKLVTGDVLYNTAFFGGSGMAALETITYHTLALGFIASTFKSSDAKLSRQRTIEIFNTGVTTVSSYLLQAILGFGITLIAARIVKGFFPAAGMLLPFGYGQGSGQAMNYGIIYETEYGFSGGKSFGLTIAALGFLSASIGGVVHLNLLKRRGKIVWDPAASEFAQGLDEEVQSDNEIPMQGSMDKSTVQIAFVFSAYFLAYLMMLGLGTLLPGLRSVIFGFNFLLAVLSAALMKGVINHFHRKNIIHRKYLNNFLMTRISNFFFDIMVVAGIAAIRLGILEQYWGIILLLGVTGLVFTYFYNHYVAHTLFPDYAEEQFLMMYGMMTGTASTGVILLREIDGQFKTPAADNLVYQNFPAIVFGFPMMMLATMAPRKPILTYVILVVFFLAMNLLLFRSKIFRRRKQPVQK